MTYLPATTGDVHWTYWGPHSAVWSQSWISGDTNAVAPLGTSVLCVVCGLEQDKP